MPPRTPVEIVRQFRVYIEKRLAQGETGVLFFHPLAQSPLPPSPGPALAHTQPLTEWETFTQAVQSCQACSLAQSRQHVVVGEGNPEARLVLVGEAPGADEDRQGRPFVGAAGQLLTKIIAAIGLKREQVYICNILKCRPPGNRNPLPAEIQACSGHLHEQLKLLRPELICTLGTFAAQTLLNTQEPIGRLRGQIHHYHDIPVIPTLHPAALLYHPQNKRLVWEDMKRIAACLGLEIGQSEKT